jgi:hypothetical protein
MFTTHFCGNKISDYGREHGFVDYATLAKSFDAVLNNNIVEATGWENWETENGYMEYYEDNNGNTYDYDSAQERISELEEKQLELDEESDEYAEIQEDIDNLNDPHYEEVYQYYIISDNGADILKRYTHEIVIYNAELDMYVWCVTHWGTSWDYVLTDIPCEKSK